MSDQHLEFRAGVRDWVNTHFPKAVARELEAREFEYPQVLWDEMIKAGYLRIGLPEAYGGSGEDVGEQVAFIREIARNLAGLTWTWGISAFSAKSIAVHGSEQLKSRVLPRLAAGELKLAMAFTEPAGGTDLLRALTTRAQRSEGGWLLNGQKKWSGTANVADYVMVLARTSEGEGKPARGLTVFLVPKGTEGFRAEPIPKFGMRAIASCDVYLEDVFVPDDLILGEIGNGWYQMFDTLDNERICLAALCLGVLDGILEDAVAYAKERHAFGKPIGQLQQIQGYVAEIAVWQKQTELVTLDAARLQTEGRPCRDASNMAKLIASEYASKAADVGIQILGGIGHAYETDMQRYWRDTRHLRIGPNSNEMARNLIAESFGLPRSY